LLHQYGTDYAAVDHRNVDTDTITAFFAPQPFTLRKFENQQIFDYDGLKGRLLSSSYTPEPGHPNHGPVLDALRALFEKHQIGGKVFFDYVTLLYFGRLVRQLEA
jgi:hypothetical protein